MKTNKIGINFGMKPDTHKNKLTGSTPDNSASLVIDSLIQELNVAKGSNDAIKTLLSFSEKNPETTPNIKAGMFLYRNYYMMPARLGKSPDFVGNMQYLKDNGYCPTAAPELVGMPISEDKKFCVVITKINDSEGGDLLPYYCNTADEDKRRKFARELITLLNETSLYNPAMLDESYQGWYLTPKEKNIVFDNWNTLSKCASEEEKSSIKKEILKMCALTYE